MLVPPPPILTPLLRAELLVFPVPALATFFHQPMAIRPPFAFIPFVPVAAIAVIVAVMFFGYTDYRRKQRAS
jgi:hypothetical protein